MPSTASNDTPVKPSEGALEQALRILRRRKFLFLQALILIPILAFVFSQLQEKQYTATSTLLFRASPLGLLAESGTSSTFVDPAREAATNEELVVLPVVSDEAAEKLDDPSVTGGDVFASVSVDSSAEADVATISATTTSPELSASMADAYAEAYIDFRREADRSQLQQAIDLITQSQDELTPEQLSGAQGQKLADRLERLELARALQTGQAELVQNAAPPTSASSPQTTRNVFLGVILGAVLGFALAALAERVDRRIQTEEELESIFGLPILARVPRTRALAGGKGPATDLASSPEIEAFRTLRMNLNYLNVDGGQQSILVASAEPGDGKSTVALHLATTMAEMGDNVVLIGADLHKGSRATVKTGGWGLSAVLAGEPLEGAVVPIDIASEGGEQRILAMLPSGSAPPNPSELLASQRMRSVISELQDRYETVIIDSPALGSVSDALALVPEVSRIILVSGLGTTTRDGARKAMNQLSILDAEPSGLIANFTKVDNGGYAYYRGRAAAKA